MRFLWHTEGKGNPVTGEGGVQTLARDGAWEPGSRHRFTFDFPAPWGPLSYDGNLLKVHWDLEARLDRSLLRPEVTEKIPVLLRGTPPPEKASLGPVPQDKEKLEARKRGLSRAWVAVGMTLLVGGIAFGALREWDFQGVGRLLLFLLMGGGLLLTLRGMWDRLGRGKLGEPTVQLSTTEVRRGGDVRFSVAIRPDKRTELRSLEAILECEERVVYGHGQYKSRSPAHRVSASHDPCQGPGHRTLPGAAEEGDADSALRRVPVFWGTPQSARLVAPFPGGHRWLARLERALPPHRVALSRSFTLPGIVKSWPYRSIPYHRFQTLKFSSGACCRSSWLAMGTMRIGF